MATMPGLESIAGDTVANKDVAIPIVFPDYRIQVDTPEFGFNVPDLLPRVNVLPARLSIPASRQRMPYLGHAGILFIDGGSGSTRYFEYGRYDGAGVGWVQARHISDVKLSKTGRPTRTSMLQSLKDVSAQSGQMGRISAAYIELDAGAFRKMDLYARIRESQNKTTSRTPYSLWTNSCLHFMKATAEAGGASMPPVVAPQPAGYIVEVRLLHPDLDYRFSQSLSIEGVPLE
jgi:hypothetical protein